MEENVNTIKNRLIEIVNYLPSQRIIPSILTNDINEFNKEFELYCHVFRLIELDILDNTLIKNQTLSLKESLKIANEHLKKTGYYAKVGLHFMTNNFDIELVRENLNIIDELIVSCEIVNVDHRFFDELLAFMLTTNKSFRFGIYFEPKANVLNYNDEINFFDFVQLMTVNPGAQGKSFLPDILNFIPQIYEKGFKIKVDGGINPENLKNLSKEKLSNLNMVSEVSVGSYLSSIFKK